MRNHPKVTSINNVTPIRYDVSISHAGPTPPTSYTEEAVWCQRYEDNKCRVCDTTRLPKSPWCPIHFPWWTEDLGEVSKEPR